MSIVIMRKEQLSVFIENKPGRLTKLTRLLANANIDIRALSIADTSDYGVLRLITDDPVNAKAILKESGFTVSLTNVIAIEIPDIPGSFADIIAYLSDNSIEIEYTYAFIARRENKACVILRVGDIDNAISLLEKYNK